MRDWQLERKKLQFVKDLCKNPIVTDDLGTPKGSGDLTALLSFIAQNVRSYRDEVIFSLEATRLANSEVVHSLATAGIKDPVKVLPAAGIFGANASGKSQLLRAMSDMRSIVINSFRRGDRTSSIRRRPFLLDEKARKLPSRFEIDLILEGVRWQYGFEMDDERVLGEYAYHYPNGRQALVFNRDLDVVRFGASFRVAGRTLMPLLRENALLLSVAGAVKIKVVELLFEWFLNNLRFVDPRSRESRALFTANLTQYSNTRESAVNLLRAADLGIVDIKRIPPDPEMKRQIKRLLPVLEGDSDFEDYEYIDLERIVIPDSVNLIHEGVNEFVGLEIEDESAGTMSWSGMIVPVLNALGRGDVLLVDGLGGSLHPDLVEQIIDLFQDTRSNPHCAQLIFNSHNVTIMERRNPRSLGRDQLWITEKLSDGVTTLFSIAEFKTRPNEAVDRRYLEGRFGGVPCLIPGEFTEAVKLVRFGRG